MRVRSPATGVVRHAAGMVGEAADVREADILAEAVATMAAECIVAAG